MNRSGEDEDDEELEFFRRQSAAASLQNSTHLGFRPPETVSRLRREKFDDDDDDRMDLSLMDLCFNKKLGSGLRRSEDSRSKKSDKSNPQQKTRFSSTKKIGFPANEGVQGI